MRIQSLDELFTPVSIGHSNRLRLAFTPCGWYKFGSQQTEFMTTQRSAPVYLNLLRIRLPVGAVTSIAHRVSGILLFLSLPFLLYLMDLSLQGPGGFDKALAMVRNSWFEAGYILIIWSLLHHLLSGIRFLLIDIEQGVTLQQARRSAWLVNCLALVLTLVCGWRLL
jgi:succinate dehydrogenase / fumarate reductase, cytochrome b subunit